MIGDRLQKLIEKAAAAKVRAIAVAKAAKERKKTNLKHKRIREKERKKQKKRAIRDYAPESPTIGEKMWMDAHKRETIPWSVKDEWDRKMERPLLPRGKDPLHEFYTEALQMGEPRLPLREFFDMYVRWCDRSWGKPKFGMRQFCAQARKTFRTVKIRGRAHFVAFRSEKGLGYVYENNVP